MANKQNMSNKIKKAIISLSDKSDLKFVLNALKKYKVNVISSGGTSKKLKIWALSAQKYQSIQILMRF